MLNISLNEFGWDSAILGGGRGDESPGVFFFWGGGRFPENFEFCYLLSAFNPFMKIS